MEAKRNLKNLEIFSKKMMKPLTLSVDSGRLALAGVANMAISWLDKGWSNSSSNWMDNGWNNSVSNWMDKGWNNSSSSWSDKGWNNSRSSWSDSGWSNSDSGCFITTACVEHMGLTDDCDQLTTLRLFRDKLVEEDPEFRTQVLEYYKNAPLIVQQIMQSDDKDLVFQYLYSELVEPCVQMLKENKSNEAKQHYIDVYKSLAKRYLPQEIKQ